MKHRARLPEESKNQLHKRSKESITLAFVLKPLAEVEKYNGIEQESESDGLL